MFARAASLSPDDEDFAPFATASYPGDARSDGDGKCEGESALARSGRRDYVQGFAWAEKSVDDGLAAVAVFADEFAQGFGSWDFHVWVPFVLVFQVARQVARRFVVFPVRLAVCRGRTRDEGCRSCGGAFT